MCVCVCEREREIEREQKHCIVLSILKIGYQEIFLPVMFQFIKAWSFKTYRSKLKCVIVCLHESACEDVCLSDSGKCGWVRGSLRVWERVKGRTDGGRAERREGEGRGRKMWRERWDKKTEPELAYLREGESGNTQSRESVWERERERENKSIALYCQFLK